ncbi:hypothetical protein FDG2_2192 [Candidatus Protofrankia californiensis]|uniref:Uncharacterized protein n=1 Tax=Candidatus Protofrankia californiensis TaxID=1839754 RepID=A0A1C3NX65_9ACTN|nr:hypothetical protein FDG2_2192 [Candidatus Protofrankia californiensis]
MFDRWVKRCLEWALRSAVVDGRVTVAGLVVGRAARLPTLGQRVLGDAGSACWPLVSEAEAAEGKIGVCLPLGYTCAAEGAQQQTRLDHSVGGWLRLGWMLADGVHWA